MADRKIKLAVLNLENVSSVSILSAVAAEIETSDPDFVIFTNVMMEAFFPKALNKALKAKGYTSDSSGPLGPKGNLPTREIVFRKKTINLDGKVVDTHFDKSILGFRTYVYQLPTGIKDPPSRKVILKAFTLDPEVDRHLRTAQLTHVLLGDTDLQVPEIVVSDFKILSWETYDQPSGWVDVYDLKGSENEDANYEENRRDRVWFRDGTAEAEALTSIEINDPHDKLRGAKKITVGTLKFSN